MKRKNFPGRKMQRHIDARIRAEGRHGTWSYRGYTEAEQIAIDQARTQRSKSQ